MGQTEISARRFHLLSDPIRLKIILLLRDGEMCVGALASSGTQPAESVIPFEINA